MSTDKPNQNVAHHELNQHNQTIIIALDIENISFVTNAIHAIKSLLDVGKAFPFRFFCLFIPILESRLGLRVLGVVCNKCTFSDYSHII